MPIDGQRGDRPAVARWRSKTTNSRRRPTKKVCILYNVLLRWWCRAARSFQNLLIYFSLEGANPKELRETWQSHMNLHRVTTTFRHIVYTQTHSTAQHIEKNKNKIVEILDSFNFVWSMLRCWSFPLNLHTRSGQHKKNKKQQNAKDISHTFGWNRCWAAGHHI